MFLQFLPLLPTTSKRGDNWASAQSSHHAQLERLQPDTTRIQGAESRLGALTVLISHCLPLRPKPAPIVMSFEDCGGHCSPCFRRRSFVFVGQTAERGIVLVGRLKWSFALQSKAMQRKENKLAQQPPQDPQAVISYQARSHAVEQCLTCKHHRKEKLIA